MRDKFYADNRDLVKWAILFQLAKDFCAHMILQLAFYQPSEFAKITINKKEYDISPEVLAHFRDIRKIAAIQSEIRVTVFDIPFNNRYDYIKNVLSFLRCFQNQTCVVFLDPDIGLEPFRNPNLDHVLNNEAKDIWDAIKSKDVYVFYQHQTNRAGRPWIEPKRKQLEDALELDRDSIEVAYGSDIARDVVFFYKQKP